MISQTRLMTYLEMHSFLYKIFPAINLPCGLSRHKSSMCPWYTLWAGIVQGTPKEKILTKGGHQEKNLSIGNSTYNFLFIVPNATKHEKRSKTFLPLMKYQEKIFKNLEKNSKNSTHKKSAASGLVTKLKNCIDAALANAICKKYNFSGINFALCTIAEVYILQAEPFFFPGQILRSIFWTTKNVKNQPIPPLDMKKSAQTPS